MGYVKCECCLRVVLVVGAEIKDRCESLMASGRTPRVPKGPSLKSSAAHVPKVRRAGQIQCMRFASKSQLSMRNDGQLRKPVFVIHQVVERESRKWTRRGK